MNKAEVIQTIRDIGVIPVVRAQSADEAMQAIDAIRQFMQNRFPMKDLDRRVCVAS